MKFQISSPSHPSKILISNAWVVENLDLPRFKINSTINKQWNHLQDIQIEVDNSQEISILIGADYPHLHISQDVRMGNDSEPIATSTLSGWVLLGEQITSEQISWLRKQNFCQILWKSFGH